MEAWHDISTNVNASGRIRVMSTSTAPEALTQALTGCCDPAQQPLTEEQAEQIARVFKALADPSRVKLYSLIASAAPAGMCACGLTEPVGLSQPTDAHHLHLPVHGG